MSKLDPIFGLEKQSYIRKSVLDDDGEVRVILEDVRLGDRVVALSLGRARMDKDRRRGHVTGKVEESRFG